MQLIFIVTGLVSIKSLTEMITQLVGQGDALKDGADTMKEAKKLAGQATGAAIHGAGLAAAGVRGVAAVGKTVASSPAGQKLKQAAGDLRDWAGDKKDTYVANSVGSTDMRHWVGRRVVNNRARVAEDDRIRTEIGRKDYYWKRAMDMKDKRNAARLAGDNGTADRYDKMAKAYLARSHQADKLEQDKPYSVRGKFRFGAIDTGTAVKGAAIKTKGIIEKAEKAIGFEDGVGVTAAIKGDHRKDTVINKFLYGSSRPGDKDGGSNVYNNIKNSSKFVFNVTGAKGDVKDFLDNADVLDAIEKGDTALARQMNKLVGYTGAKSDAAKANRAASEQAKANAGETAKALNGSFDSITKQLEAIKEQLEENGGGGSKP